MKILNFERRVNFEILKLCVLFKVLNACGCAAVFKLFPLPNVLRAINLDLTFASLILTRICNIVPLKAYFDLFVRLFRD